MNACQNEAEVSRPEIILSELGYDNSKEAAPGSDLHIEAEIVADGKINTIQVTVHPEGDHKSENSNYNYETPAWEFDSIFTEFKGLKNTSFHKHAEVPESADTGHYHFHLIVTDLEGNQSSVEEEVLISASALVEEE